MTISAPMRHLLLPLLALALLLAGCAPEGERPLRVGTNQWPGYEPLYLARDLGHLDREVRMVEFTSTSEVMNALRNGLVEAGGLTLDEALTLQSEGVELRVVLVMDVSDGADALVARPEIDSLAELEGHPVGYESTALGAFMLSQALEHGGLAFEDVEPVSVTADEHVRAYRRGEVDAVVTFDPARSRLLEAGARELFTSADIPDRIVDVLAVRAEVTRRRPEVLSRLVDDWFRTLAWMRDHRPEALERMAPRLQTTPGHLEQAYAGMHLPTRAENRELLGGDSPRLADTLDALLPVLERRDLLSGPVEGRAMLTDRFLAD